METVRLRQCDGPALGASIGRSGIPSRLKVLPRDAERRTIGQLPGPGDCHLRTAAEERQQQWQARIGRSKAGTSNIAAATRAVRAKPWPTRPMAIAPVLSRSRSTRVIARICRSTTWSWSAPFISRGRFITVTVSFSRFSTSAPTTPSAMPCSTSSRVRTSQSAQCFRSSRSASRR